MTISRYVHLQFTRYWNDTGTISGNSMGTDDLVSSWFEYNMEIRALKVGRLQNSNVKSRRTLYPAKISVTLYSHIHVLYCIDLELKLHYFYFDEGKLFCSCQTTIINPKYLGKHEFCYLTCFLWVIIGQWGSDQGRAVAWLMCWRQLKPWTCQ